MEKLNPYKQATGRILNTIKRGATDLGRAGAFGPLVQSVIPRRAPGLGAEAGRNSSALGSAMTGAGNQLGNYANGTQPTAPQVPTNVPAGVTQPQGGTMTGAPAPRPTAAMGTTQRATTATPPPLPTAPAEVSPQPQDEVTQMQDDLSTLKQSRDKEWFDIYKPAGLKTVTGAGGLAGLVETEYANKQQTLADKLATVQASRDLQSREKQQTFDNEYKNQQLALEKERNAIARMSAMRSGSPSISIGDQIKLQEYQSAQNQKRADLSTQINALIDIGKFKDTITGTKQTNRRPGISAGWDFFERGVNNWFSPNQSADFKALRSTIGNTATIEALLAQKGVQTDKDTAMIRASKAINAARTDEAFWKAVDEMQSNLVQSSIFPDYVSTLSAEEALRLRQALSNQ